MNLRMLATSAVDREFRGLVGFKPRTIKLAFAVSPLRTQL